VVGRLSPPIYSGPGALYTDSAGQQFTENEYQAWLQAGGAPALAQRAPLVTDTNYPQGYTAPPASASPPVSYTQPPADSGGGGGGQSYADAASAFGPDTSTAPAAAAAPEQQYAPAPADNVAAPSKLNPFVIVGAALVGGAVLMLNKHH
jgi:hypothetical protein